MKNQRIAFIGSPCHQPVRNAQIGECLRTVNLRYHNGSLVPVGSLPVMAALTDSNRTICYVHNCNGARHVISIQDKTIYHDIDLSDTTSTHINRTLLTLNNDLSDVRSIGNTLIIITCTDIFYLLHGNKGYKALGTQPPMPLIRFHIQPEEEVTADITELAIHGSFLSLSDENYETFYNHLMGRYYNMREDVYQKHLFLQPVIIRYALRLYDGSHILPSPPILLGNINKKAYNEEKETTFEYHSDEDETRFSAFPLYFTPYSIQYTIDTLQLEDWSDIVMGIDIFISKEIPMLNDNPENTSTTYTRDNGTKVIAFTLPTCDNKKQTEYVAEESLFYKLYTIEPDKAITHTPQKLAHEIHQDDLIYRPTLTTYSSNFARIGAKQAYVYNNRLHLADITQHYYEGYPALLFAHSNNPGSSNAPVYTRTTIKQPNGEMGEVIACTTIPYFDNKLSAIISYPDLNAVSIEIVIRHNGYEYRHTLPLTSCTNENRSSYINEGLDDIDITTWEQQAITQENLSNFITTPSTISREQHNRLVVSKMNNPFSFPPEQDYNISDSTIVGIATATIALSQGQYGEFPLYIFTKRGIWSMQQGNETQCYTHGIPINNECIDERLPITATEQAIIYRSGDNICAISGSQGSVILPLAETIQEEFGYELATIIPNQEAAHCDNKTLKDFFNKTTRTGYNHTLNELIFYNTRHDYCIVLHTTSGHLYRRERAFENIVDGHGKLIAQGTNNALYDLYKESDAFTQITLITHPISFAPDTYTRLRQLLWRMKGNFVDIESIVTALHEPDGENNITHRLSYNGYLAGHLPIRHIAPPHKYYRLFLNGVVSPDFRLECADVAYEIVENNKLR